MYNSTTIEYSLFAFTVGGIGAVIIAASTGVFTTPVAHGLAVGARVSLGTITTTTGVVAGTPYFVLTTPSTTTFTLSTTPGGSALSLVGDGSTTGVALARLRKIRYEFQQAVGAFGGVYVNPVDTVYANETGIHAAVIGDSTCVQTGATLSNGGWHVTLGKLLGWGDVWAIGIGACGFTVSSATGNITGSATRVADAVNCNPDIILIPSSQNDNGADGATLTAAALAAFQAYRAAFPGRPIICGGNHASASGPSAAAIANEAAVKAAFDAWGDVNSWWVPIISTTATGDAQPWIYGTGYLAHAAGNGNADVLVHSDGAHMSQAGHNYNST
jgi:hypothetical protein